MCDVPVFYATSEGQTRRIAERIASTLREQGLGSEAFDLSNRRAEPDWVSARAVVIGGSIHAGSHQRAVREFVERELRHLAVRPSAFFSVSLSAGSRNPAEVDAARSLAVGFVRAAGWEPRRLACFAGTLAYTKYGLLKRLAMQYIARAEGAPTDPSRDYEFTDWNAVRQFALDVSQDVLGGRERRLTEQPQARARARGHRKEEPMATDNRRLVVAHPFERTVVSVIDAFLREGFTITPLGGGDLRQHPDPGNPLRFAMLQAAHPDLAGPAGVRHAGGAPGLCCQIALYELVGRCTLVTAATPVTAAWLSDRLASALGAIARKASGTEAA